MGNVVENKKGFNVLKPIGAVVLVLVVFGFIKWAMATNDARNPRPLAPESQPQSVR